MVACYSPSSTETWLRCPVKWLLGHDWEPRILRKPALARILGQAVGAGVTEHYKYRAGDLNALHPASQAGIVAAISLAAMRAKGHVVYDTEEGYAETLADLAGKGVEKYIANDPVPPSWRIVMVEKPLGPEKCRPDVVVETPQGQVVVVDLKTKRSLEPRYQQSTLEDYRESWQMRHYAWRVADAIGRDVSQYAITIAVLEPRFRVIWDVTILDSELKATWLAGAQAAWNMMARQKAGEPPWMAASHRDRYGMCEFYKACIDYRWEEGLMGQDYVRRRKESL